MGYVSITLMKSPSSASLWQCGESPDSLPSLDKPVLITSIITAV